MVPKGKTRVAVCRIGNPFHYARIEHARRKPLEFHDVLLEHSDGNSTKRDNRSFRVCKVRRPSRLLATTFPIEVNTVGFIGTCDDNTSPEQFQMFIGEKSFLQSLAEAEGHFALGLAIAPATHESIE